jgi:hypothetical protein
VRGNDFLVHSWIYSLGSDYIVHAGRLLKGGNINHGHEQKLHYRNMENTQKVRNSLRGVT